MMFFGNNYHYLMIVLMIWDDLAQIYQLIINLFPVVGLKWGGMLGLLGFWDSKTIIN